MKWIFCNCFISVMLFASSAPSLAASQVIYGLENARYFKGSHANSFYIQAGSFLDKSKAERFQALLRTKTHYPVKQTLHKHFHVVTIGPISSSAKVRLTADKILSKQSFAPIRHVASNQKLTTPTRAVVTQPKQNTAKITPISLHTAPTPIVIHQQQPVKPSHSYLSFLSSGHWLLAFGAGIQFPQFSSNIKVNNNSGFPAPYDNDLYSTQKHFQPVITLAFGRRYERDSQWFPAYSANIIYQHFPSTNIGNQITQYSDPEFTNYDYNLDVSSDVLLAALKLNLVQCRFMSPYLTGGIGEAFNKMSDYTESPLPDINAVRESPSFGTNITGQFAYSVGAGVDFQLAKEVFLSAEYRYQDLGKFTSGKGAGTWSNRSLSLNSYTTNMVMLNLNYLIA